MRFFQRKEQPDLDALKKQVGEGKAIKQMTETEGWKLLSNLLEDQLSAYKADLLVGCKDWNDYLDKRAKAHAISLLLVDTDDYIQRGIDAEKQLIS